MGFNATWIVPLVAAAGSGVQTDQARQSAKRGRARQGQAQQRAEAAAVSQQRQNDQAQRRANRRTPDLAALLASAQQAGQRGVAGTNLTGPAGAGGLQLGRTVLG